MLVDRRIKLNFYIHSPIIDKNQPKWIKDNMKNQQYYIA